MITLLLIRHGIAEDTKAGSPDSERGLTVEGWEKTRAAMRGLIKRGYAPTRAISSPYRRAAETLICLKEATPGGFPIGYWDGLRPGGSVELAEVWLREQLAEAAEGEVLALVGHQPFMSDMVLHLTDKLVDFKKASCAVLHWEGNAFAFATYFAPSELRGGE